jgi:hypothetical protein
MCSVGSFKYCGIHILSVYIKLRRYPMKFNKEKIKTSIWGAICGGIIVMIIGFGWGGWVLGSTSQSKADTMVEAALVARLVPMCVAQFNEDAEKDKKLRELTELSSWDREKYIKEQGWATMPFEKEPDSRVADACTSQIMKDQ